MFIHHSCGDSGVTSCSVSQLVEGKVTRQCSYTTTVTEQEGANIVGQVADIVRATDLDEHVNDSTRARLTLYTLSQWWKRHTRPRDTNTHGWCVTKIAW